MDVGDLPFRYVGKHRRAKLKHVLALKSKMDAQQAALDALTQDTEALVRDRWSDGIHDEWTRMGLADDRIAFEFLAMLVMPT
jgi:hypothetical protein